jgi:hypothetical protein
MPLSNSTLMSTENCCDLLLGRRCSSGVRSTAGSRALSTDTATPIRSDGVASNWCTDHTSLSMSDEALSVSSTHNNNKMGNKNKTISFRVSQEKFETLRGIAEERDLSLSAVFRDYVDMLVAHDGQVEAVPEHELNESSETDAANKSFPPKVKVPKSFVREHERLELEAEHLREQLQEHKQYVTQLRQELDDGTEEDIVNLDELDGGQEEESPYRIGSSFDDSSL